MAHYKDQVLDAIADVGNVAQFVSFRPQADNSLLQSFCRIAGVQPNFEFENSQVAIAALLKASADGSVNVRSFKPDSPRSQEFVYGISSVDEVLSVLERLGREGLCLIVNETIDVNDGGVSGVVQGDLIEFSPDDTPRCVEKPGVASLPILIGAALLQTVYGFKPNLAPVPNGRAEFSIHPKPRGWRQSHTILWEHELGVSEPARPALSWPNRFSRHIGDKAFGLLMAHHLSVAVPKTIVIGRRVAPFQFGLDTGSHEVWTRTCPIEPLPGLFTTVKGWTDPFMLLANEDPEASALQSVLSQAAVRAAFSGAAIVTGDGQLLIEGRHGEGARFMLGLDQAENLPSEIIQHVEEVYGTLARALGAVRFEWVHDGQRIWIVQLHCGATVSTEQTLVPGEASNWVEFDVKLGLAALRDLLEGLGPLSGVLLRGRVGLTSHIADLLRKSGKPAKLS